MSFCNKSNVIIKKKKRLKDSGDLASSTSCDCMNYVHVKLAKFKANFSFFFYVTLQKSAKCTLRNSYFHLSTEPANIYHSICLFVHFILTLSDCIKRIMQIKYFMTLFRRKEDFKFTL